ncbi:MAG TPA: amino acid adenylation domain-containing protein [Vicinamibacterales bacterium]
MTALEILTHLSRQGVQLWAEGEALRCRAPKGAIAGELREALRSQKRELLALLRAPGARAGLPRILPSTHDRHEPFPLTDMQQAYWIGRGNTFDLGNVTCHLYLEIDNASLDPERFQHAWRRLVSRHEMLRAVVLPDGRQQILREVPSYLVDVTDLRGQTSEAVAAAQACVRERLSHQVFQPDRWPLFEVCITRWDAGTRLHVSVDGLIADGWSALLLFRDLSAFYENPDEARAPLQASFRDYVLALDEVGQSAAYRRSNDYWRQRLPNLPAAPQLPLAKAPSAVPHPTFRRRTRRLEKAAWRRLKERAAAGGLTPAGSLLAAYGEVLATWSRSQHFLINVPRFNRLALHPEVGDVIGNFSSFTLLEFDGRRRESFLARAQRLQKQLLADLDHHHVTGMQVLRELSRLHGHGTEAAMPVVFTNLPKLPGADHDGSLFSRFGEPVYMISQTPQVWLDNQAYEAGGDLVIAWDAVEELFPDRLLDDMFEAHFSLLETLADRDEPWRDRITLLPARQAGQRAAVNATDARVPDHLLHEMIDAQVAVRPDHPAVLSSRGAMTFRELDARSGQVAHWLCREGAAPNSLVAVVMEKGPEQIAAVLAIVKAGAAYLPIDVASPPDRLHRLLAKGEVTLVLTQSWVDARSEWPAGVRRLCVDNAVLTGLDDGPLETVQGPDDLAYVIFTSGSTGDPKGVMVSHRSAANAVLAANRRCVVTPDDRILALTALHHDLSVYDVFGVLAAGATIVLPDADRLLDPRHWLEVMRRERVSLWNTVPAMMEMLVEYAEHDDARNLGALRSVILGGDWIPVTLPDRIRRLAPSVTVHSIGGPTETTIWNIWHTVGQVDPASKSIPYGKPIENNRYAVLNEALEPCPEWVPGELYCAGVGVAHGYWRDEQRTAERFITHPVTGERLYATGDLGRYLPDGNIEFLGREDFQVKIRGQRIELGEIESVLLQHPDVRAAVAAAAGEGQQKRVIAYVVPAASGGRASSNGHGDAADALPIDHDGLIADPIERIEFKLARHGLRHDTDKPSVPLNGLGPDATLAQAYAARASHRRFGRRSGTRRQLAGLLSCLYQIEQGGLAKHRYPSAGGLYPVQVYVVVKPNAIEDLTPGAYYYHPRLHRLVLIAAGAQIDRDGHIPHNRAVFDGSAFSLLLVGKMEAIAPMYGALARDFALIEAGCMTQLLMTEASRWDLGLCPIGSLDIARMRPLLELGPDDELLHSFCGGLVPNDDERVDEDAAAVDVPMAARLREWLSARLPQSLVPAELVTLDRLPTTPNGKVDRKALAALAPRPAAGGPPRAPQNDLERIIASVWQRALGVDHVAVDANYFDLGINSLTMVKIYTALRAELARDFPLMTMFKHPTVHDLAMCLAEGEAPREEFDEGRSRAAFRSARLQQRRAGRTTVGADHD